MARLRTLYKDSIKGKLKEKFEFKNDMQIPKLEKIIVNCVTKDCVTNGKNCG